MTDATESRQKVKVPERAAEFTVGHCTQTVGFFLFNKRLNFAVLNSSQLFTGDFTGGKCTAGILKGLRTEKAADNVSTIGGIDSRHILFLLMFKARFPREDGSYFA